MSKNKNIELLQAAISDIGYWSWWAHKLPEGYQVEFGAVQLWSPPTTEGRPPSGKIAINFSKPSSISYLVRQGASEKLAPNWPELLHNDEIDPPGISYDYFGLNNDEIISAVLKQAKQIETIHGFGPKIQKFFEQNYRLAFWAGEVGLAISSESFKLYNHLGEVKLEEIEEMHNKWWSYLKEYWDLRGTPNQLPEDYACEVTIPLKG